MSHDFENPMDVDPNEFKKVVTSRRSVRIFKKENVPPEVINDCLDLALLAPNSSNLQPWEFYWVRNKDTKVAVAKACYSQPAAMTAAELIVCVARTQTWKKNAEKMIDFFSKQQPSVSNAAIDYYAKTLPKELENQDLLIWAVKSSCLAAENFMLALRSHAFDSCPMEGFQTDQVKELLKLPKDAYITMIIAVGRRAENGIYGPRIRFEREQFIKEV